MKCIFCASDTLVLATRKVSPYTTRRHHRCFDNVKHVFNTIEAPVQLYEKRRSIVTSNASYNKAYAVRKRNRQIILSKLNNSQEARRMGLSEASIRQIRKAAKGSK